MGPTRDKTWQDKYKTPKQDGNRTFNTYIDFLRDLRRRNKTMDIITLTRRGARVWKKMVRTTDTHKSLGAVKKLKQKSQKKKNPSKKVKNVARRPFFKPGRVRINCCSLLGKSNLSKAERQLKYRWL